MIALNVDTLLKSIKVVRGKKDEVRAAADRQYRSLVLSAYRSLLFVAPQFSSDFVSNFDIETPSSPDRGYQQWPEKVGRTRAGGVTWAEPHHAGDDSAALRSAYMRGVQRMRYVKFGQPVFFVNPTNLQIRSPEVIGPDGPRKLRDEVAIDAWSSISSYLQARHGGP